MNKPQSNSPRARLQALRAIPERDRTDAEWDEMNELEIMLAAENRRPQPGQPPRPQGGAPGNPPKPKGAPPPHGNPSERKFHKRSRRRKAPRQDA